jgi:ParB/RepB/Spo0J family partition protein
MTDELLTEPPRWHVKSEGEKHELFYGDEPQSAMRGPAGLETLRNMAKLFNTKKKVPVNHAIQPDEEETPELFPQNNPTETNMSETAVAPVIENAALMKDAELRRYPAGNFMPYPHNRTITQEAIEKMKASILEVGIIQPLLARPLRDTDGSIVNDDVNGLMVLELMAGECRWRAAESIGQDYEVPVLIREITDKEASRIHAIENFQRTELDDIEQGRAMKHMKDQGWSMEEIQDALGVAKDFIYRRMRLLELPEEAQQAVKDKNLTIQTAMKIADLPAKVQEEAIKAVVEPMHRPGALPEREALKIIDENFVEPQKRLKAWNSRRKELEAEYPEAEWMPYEKVIEAQDWRSDFVQAENEPREADLSDAARTGRVAVPTWKELAVKYGGKIYIGFSRTDESKACLWVEAGPLKTAEILNHDSSPEDCLFPHPNLKEVVENARKKADEVIEKRNAALLEERTKAVYSVMESGGVSLSLTKERNLVTAWLLKLIEDGRNSYNQDSEEIGFVLGLEVGEDEDKELFEDRLKEAARKLIKTSKNPPFDLLGRIAFCLGMPAQWDFVNKNMAPDLAGLLLTSKSFNAKDFPALSEFIPKQEEEAEEDAA